MLLNEQVANPALKLRLVKLIPPEGWNPLKTERYDRVALPGSLLLLNYRGLLPW